LVNAPQRPRETGGEAPDAEAGRAIDLCIANGVAAGEGPDEASCDLSWDHAAGRWQLVGLRPDGGRCAVYPIEGEVTEIGRRGRDIAEADDEHMADHHASLVYEAGEFYIADSGQGSGVWLRIDDPDGVQLADQGQLWLGKQILVASCAGGSWTLIHYGPDGLSRKTHVVGPDGLTVGRDAPIDLDPDDSLLSRRHARFCVENEQLKVYDCAARNGTFLKLTGAEPLREGSQFRIATRRYRLERGD